MKCPQCRADVPDAARFCPSCGHELLVVGDQRRVATVVFADLVGFTSLSERLDPEQVKALVDRCFARLAEDIQAFGGRVDKVVGDAIVALFGAPVAHEDDAERAVRAGLRMQQTIGTVSADFDHAVQIRVGINTGEVLVGSVSAGREYTAMGDVVNTASRLQTAAEPGTVLVGPDTWAATRQIIAYEEIESVIAKGKELPVRAWIAREATVPPGHRPQRRQSSMVGRDTEMALLSGVTETAIDRSRASLLLIHGEAGMGKSRLAAETAQRADDELGALVLEGRCVPYGEANVWWPVADALRTATGLEPTADADVVEDKVRQIVATSLEQSGRFAELERVVAGLLHLLGHDGALREIDATRAREEAIRSVVALAEGYTHRQPLLVVLSDLHWADQEVLDLVDTLLTRLARRPFVLLATARRSLRERWNPAPDAANTVVLHLDPLGADASRRLLFELTGGDVHPAMAAMLVDRAGGNPFYLEELVALITEAGVHTVDQLLASEAGELPSTLRGLVAARLDALSPRDRAVLDDAAVLGRRNKIAALVTMAEVKRGLDAETARANVESLAAREFFVLEGDIYAFRSDVIREVAYSTVTKADRARSHAGIAVWMEQNEDTGRNAVVDQIANHYAAAAELSAEIGNVTGVPDDVRERAVDWLCRATSSAEEAYLPAVVNVLASRALTLIEDEGDPRRHHLLRSRARGRIELYDIDAGRADAEEAAAVAAASGDRSAIGDALLVQAEAHQHRGEFTQSFALLDEAHEQFAAVDDELGCARAHRLTGMVHIFAGDFAAADRSLMAALDLFERGGDRRGAAWAHQNLSWSAYVSGRIEEAEARVNQAMQTFEELGDPGGLTWTRGILAWVRFHQGRNDEAVALATEVGADARDRGERWGEAMMVVLTAAVALWSGRTDEATAASGRAVALFDEIDDVYGELQARCGLGRALVMSGDVDRGLEELATARGLASSLDDGPDQVWFSRVATLNTAVQLGDVGLGAAELDAGAHERLTRLGDSDHLVSAALHRLQTGDGAGARDALEQVHDDRGYVRCGRALLHAVAGDPTEALDAAEVVDARPHTYLDRLYAGVARALAQVRLGRIDDARSGLSGVIADADETGDRLAQAVVRLADAAIAEHGATPDARSVRGVAEQRLESLGIDAAGWRVLLADALATAAV